MEITTTDYRDIMIRIGDVNAETHFADGKFLSLDIYIEPEDTRVCIVRFSTVENLFDVLMEVIG